MLPKQHPCSYMYSISSHSSHSSKLTTHLCNHCCDVPLQLGSHCECMAAPKAANSRYLYSNATPCIQCADLLTYEPWHHPKQLTCATTAVMFPLSLAAVVSAWPPPKLVPHNST
jgi:hypothetical protein